jgi:hypothetical protein
MLWVISAYIPLSGQVEDRPSDQESVQIIIDAERGNKSMSGKLFTNGLMNIFILSAAGE